MKRASTSFTSTTHLFNTFNIIPVKSIRLFSRAYFLVIFINFRQFDVQFSLSIQSLFNSNTTHLSSFFATFNLSSRSEISSCASVHWFFVGSFAWGWLAGVVGGFGVDGWSDGSTT